MGSYKRIQRDAARLARGLTIPLPLKPTEDYLANIKHCRNLLKSVAVVMTPVHPLNGILPKLAVASMSYLGDATALALLRDAETLPECAAIHAHRECIAGNGDCSRIPCKP